MVSEAALTHLDLDRLLANLLDGVRTVMKADTAVVLLLDESADELVASWSRGLEEEVEARVRVPVGRGFAGRVAATRQPVYIADVRRAQVGQPAARAAWTDLAARRAAARRGPADRRAPRRLGEAAPLHDGRRADTAAALRPRRPRDRAGTALRGGARASRRLEFLADASELLGSTLDFHTALERLGELVVPYLADWCVVDLVRDGQLQRVAVAHTDPELHRAAFEFQERFPPAPDAAHGPARAVATGEAELIREVTDEHLRGAAAGDEELYRALRSIGMTSLICAPLVARGRVLGAITLLSDREERLYGPAELVTTEELARRVAAAVDNTLLFAEAERRAEAARVLEHIGDGVFMLDRDGIVRLWNRAAEAVTGLAAAAVVGHAATEAVPGWAAIAEAVPIAETPAAAAAETLPLELPGRELWLSIAGVGFAEGTVYAFRDLTADRALEELRSDFVSTVSHELRTRSRRSTARP